MCGLVDLDRFWHSTGVAKTSVKVTGLYNASHCIPMELDRTLQRQQAVSNGRVPLAPPIGFSGAKARGSPRPPLSTGPADALGTHRSPVRQPAQGGPRQSHQADGRSCIADRVAKASVNNGAGSRSTPRAARQRGHEPRERRGRDDGARPTSNCASWRPPACSRRPTASLRGAIKGGNDCRSTRFAPGHARPARHVRPMFRSLGIASIGISAQRSAGDDRAEHRERRRHARPRRHAYKRQSVVRKPQPRRTGVRPRQRGLGAMGTTSNSSVFGSARSTCLRWGSTAGRRSADPADDRCGQRHRRRTERRFGVRAPVSHRRGEGRLVYEPGIPTPTRRATSAIPTSTHAGSS